jgi:hypothetical protein
MKIIISFIVATYTILLINGCTYNTGRPIPHPAKKEDPVNYDISKLKDSIYRMYFGSDDDYITRVSEHNDFRITGQRKIPFTKFVGKSKLERFDKELQLSNGYYFDTVESGFIHKYTLGETIAWVNSASLFSFVPAGDTIKLRGEAYFETSSKPLTIFIEDSIKIIVSKNSKVNLSAYKIPLNPKTLTQLAEGTLLEGEFIVKNGTNVDTVKAPENMIFIVTESRCKSFRGWNTKGADSWTKLKYEYQNIALNELIERLGRRYNVAVETLDKSYLPVDFTGKFTESLDSIISRIDTLSNYARCRLSNHKIVISRK